MTGQNLIDSLTAPTEPENPSQETPSQEALREGLSFRAGVTRLLGLFAAKSIGRNLEAEDTAFNKFCTGKEPPQESPSDDMNITSAGNVYVTQTTPTPSGSQQASAGPSQKAGAGWLPKLLVGLSMLGGGAGVGYIVNDLMKPAPTTANDTDTITELDFPK